MSEQDVEKNFLPSKSPPQNNSHDDTFWTKDRVWFLYLGCGVMAQTLRGAFPALARYIQIEMGLFALQLVAIRDCFAVVVLLLMILPTLSKKSVSRLIYMKHLWMFPLIGAARSVTNVYAARFTFSIYVQLVNLLTPFTVAVASKLFLKRQLPPYTVAAIVFSFVGGFLAILGDLITDDLRLTLTDVGGLACSFGFVLSTTVYFIYIAVINPDVHVLHLQVVDTLGTIAVSLPISIAIDDWDIFSDISTADGIVFGIYVLISFSASLFQIAAIRGVGPALVGALLPWRIVPALAIGLSPILNEDLSVVNLIGVGIVAITISIYLYIQYLHKIQSMRIKEMKGFVEH